MNSKYQTANYAIYNNEKYTARPDPQDWTLKIYTKDSSMQRHGFTPSKAVENLYLKHVSPFDVSKYYREHFEAEYAGITVYIDSDLSSDDKLMISPADNSKNHKELCSMGFENIDKYLLGKLVTIQSLENIHSVQEDLLASARKNYEEEHK